MTYPQFEKAILRLQHIQLKCQKVRETGIDIIDFTDNFYFVIDTLMESLFTEGQVDLINWYMLERDPQRGTIAKDEDGNETCYDIPSLWKELNRLEWKKSSEKTSSSEKDFYYYMEMAKRGEI
jgi:hypothetical protein